MIRVLALPRYDEDGASSRMRLYQFLPALSNMGFAIDVSPLLSDGYVGSMFRGKRPWRVVVKSYWRRLRALRRALDYDVIWLEKEALPYLPHWFEKLVTRGTTPVMVDYDDAIFHLYDQHRLWLVRRLLGRKIDAVMKNAALVSVGNAYLATRARAAGASRVESLPTVVDLDRYGEMTHPAPGKSVVIGWIGSPATAKYLTIVAPALAALSRQFSIRCLAVGARPDQVAGTVFEARPWSRDHETAALAEFDVGIMPLPDDLWERGKCGFKLIQYMASAKPVVASPVGINVELVKPGENGFLATTSEDWIRALTTLIEQPHLRLRMGQAGRKLVESQYNTNVQIGRMAMLLRRAAGRNG